MGNIDKAGAEIGGCQKFAYPDFVGCTRKAAASALLEVVFCCLQQLGLQQDCLHKMSLREMFPQDNFSAALPARPFLHKHFCIECVLVQLTTYVNKEKDGSMVCQTFSFSLGFVLLGISFSVLAFLYFSIVTCDKCLILSAKTLSWLFFYIQVFSTGKLLFFSLNTLVQ